ncbi:hypothetical protein [uncultured Chryseobacterium sp.]|uniref:hypothetical protein n=1 Tax=uncultured Chryseobacterium sp. TaxID=259322 RepID=UPI0025FB96D9|nr:hypothetical protein [uncultured Chryseobacterium sp.]
MIRRLKYNEIDFDKYTHCLENSEQKNGYARKEVLDQLSGNWHILVKDDYQAVMPIHIKRKMGIDFVHMPLFCQQLGIFSKTDDLGINGAFLNFLKKKYKVFLYSFNDRNRFDDDLEKRKNYIIPVSDYAILRRKKYFKGRKSTVKMAQHLLYNEIDLNADSLEFIKNNFKGLAKEAEWQQLKNYLIFLAKNNSLKLCGAFSGNILINLALLIADQKQLSLLGLVNNENFKHENGSSFLIDRILQQYVGQQSFNFMGSNIRGIEVFFKSFGAELREYNFIENKFLKRFI